MHPTTQKQKRYISVDGSHRCPFDCFGERIDGPGLSGGLLICQGHLFPPKGHLWFKRFGCDSNISLMVKQKSNPEGLEFEILPSTSKSCLIDARMDFWPGTRARIPRGACEMRWRSGHCKVNSASSQTGTVHGRSFHLGWLDACLQELTTV